MINRQKHYKIIFIKAPETPSISHQLLQQQQQVNEEKTLVYVLVKKPESIHEIQPQVQQTVTQPSKPEVINQLFLHPVLNVWAHIHRFSRLYSRYTSSNIKHKKSNTKHHNKSHYQHRNRNQFRFQPIMPKKVSAAQMSDSLRCQHHKRHPQCTDQVTKLTNEGCSFSFETIKMNQFHHLAIRMKLRKKLQTKTANEK